jgi:D-glycerate 3-kinase
VSRFRKDVFEIVETCVTGVSPSDARVLSCALYEPLLESVLQARGEKVRERARAGLPPEPLVLSASGLPGTGKSTLVTVLSRLLSGAGLQTAGFSLDDLYLSPAERAELGRKVHPLFVHRGVPGTHDVARGLELVERLVHAGSGEVIALPRFDKLTDAAFPENEWPRSAGPPDVILLDGWFWGAKPGDTASLREPINERERDEDPKGTWRAAVQAALGVGYPELFAASEFHIHLAAPSHAASVRWRVEQGRNALRARGADENELDPAKIARFLELFERVGRLPIEFPRGYRVVLGEDHLVSELVRISPCDSTC